MDGKWHLTRGRLSDLLLMLVTANKGPVARHGLSFGVTEQIIHIYKQFLTTFSATRKVAEHYNVNTELYRRMIGDDLVYSCAFFDDDLTDLKAAQARKFKTIFERLLLDEADDLKVLDIGCGWGSFERYFPKELKAEVDGISISESQIAYARQTADEISDKGRVDMRFHKQDYRDFCKLHAGVYNRVVSIGMLEHVGRSKYAHYFNAIKEVMREDGVALVHSIVKHSPGATNLWIDRYIFPGGYSPKISEVTDGIEKSGLEIRAIHYHDGKNYIRTLQAWLANLLANEDEILELLSKGGSAGSQDMIARSTYRMFIFYLSAVQLMFHPKWGKGGIGHFIVTH